MYNTEYRVFDPTSQRELAIFTHESSEKAVYECHGFHSVTETTVSDAIAICLETDEELDVDQIYIDNLRTLPDFRFWDYHHNDEN
jgi:hypothetical protein